MLPGSGSYNLACVSALLGDDPECRKWLKQSQKSGNLPSIEHLQEDPDLDSVRKKDWFKKIITSLE